MIAAPELCHKALMGNEVPEENEKKYTIKSLIICTVQETEWTGHAAHKGEIKKPQKILVIKPIWKR